jgi:hypothetical protein
MQGCILIDSMCSYGPDSFFWISFVASSRVGYQKGLGPTGNGASSPWWRTAAALKHESLFFSMLCRCCLNKYMNVYFSVFWVFRVFRVFLAEIFTLFQYVVRNTWGSMLRTPGVPVFREENASRWRVSSQ